MDKQESLIERDPLALAMFAAWCNLPPDRLPAEMRAHTCRATAEAWGRVAAAVRAYLGSDEIASLRARVAELEEALDWALPYAQSAATDEEGLASAERAALSAAGNGE